jgi:hypothetical protein
MDGVLSYTVYVGYESPITNNRYLCINFNQIFSMWGKGETPGACYWISSAGNLSPPPLQRDFDMTPKFQKALLYSRQIKYRKDKKAAVKKLCKLLAEALK